MKIRNLIEQVAQNVRPHQPINDQHTEPNSHTTLVGFVCEGGNKVLMAADRLMTYTNGYIFSTVTHKLFAIGTNAILSGCGFWSDIQSIALAQRMLADTISGETGEELSAQGKLNLLRTILSYREVDYSSFVFGGYDIDTEGFVYSVTGSGVSNKLDYITDGSGRPGAESVLDLYWKRDFSSAEALKCSIASFMQAAKRNTYTSNPIISVPDVAFIGKRGIEWVDQKKINKVTKSMIPEYFKRQVQAEG